MNILDFVNGMGKCKVACGYDFKLSYIKLDSEYPIVGYVICSEHRKFLMEFDPDGYPKNRSDNNGIHLVPCVPVLSYKAIDVLELSKYNKIQDFMKVYQ